MVVRIFVRIGADGEDGDELGGEEVEQMVVL